MDIANEFGKISIFLTENRLVPILEELAVTMVPSVEGHCMTGKQAGHDGMEGNRARLA